jgi:hypothetical protein
MEVVLTLAVETLKRRFFDLFFVGLSKVGMDAVYKVSVRKSQKLGGSSDGSVDK